MDLQVLFSSVRKSIFGGRMSKTQVEGVEVIVAAWEKYGTGLDTGLAYILATPTWETGKRMQPVRETYATSTKQAIARLDAAFKAGKMKWVKRNYWKDGWFGRGYVQITHEDNYNGPLRDAVLAEFNVDIHADPDAALRPDVAAFILIEGVTRGKTTKSDFTKHALEDFVNEVQTDYRNARKTVNPGETDSYGPIADFATKWEEAIREARVAAGEEFRGPRASIYGGTYSKEVEDVQKLLAEKKYDVGLIDGRWGDRTANSVLAFRRKNSLPLRDNITDKDFLAALVVGEQLDVSAERANATTATLRAEGSKTIEHADKTDIVGKVSIGVGTLAVVDKTLDQVQKGSETMKRIAEVLDPVTSLIQQNFMLVLVGIGAVIVWQQWKIRKNAVIAHREGKTVA